MKTPLDHLLILKHQREKKFGFVCIKNTTLPTPPSYFPSLQPSETTDSTSSFIPTLHSDSSFKDKTMSKNYSTINIGRKIKELRNLMGEREKKFIFLCKPYTLYSHNPTIIPLQQPSIKPTPTIHSSSFKPNPVHSIAPSTAPSSKKPTSYPSFKPTKYAIIYCIDDLCEGSTGNDDFQINTNFDITIHGNGGNDLYTIWPNMYYNIITITDFNIYQNSKSLIDLSKISILAKIKYTEMKHNYDSINNQVNIVITTGQRIILENQQQDVTQNDFIGLDTQKSNNHFIITKQTWFFPTVISFSTTVLYAFFSYMCRQHLNYGRENLIFKVCLITAPSNYLYDMALNHYRGGQAPYNSVPENSNKQDSMTAEKDNEVVLPIGISLVTNKQIQLISYNLSSVAFDYYNINKPLKTSWVGPNDAILVYDHNDNQRVDSAREIVLTEWCKTAKTDFEALLFNFDTNKDKIFDKEDHEFKSFLLWQDKNQDGISQDDELTSLEEAGILAIDFNTLEEITDELRELGALNKVVVLWEDQKITHAYDLVFTHDVL